MEAALDRYRARYETYRKWGLSGENTPVRARRRGAGRHRGAVHPRHPRPSAPTSSARLRDELGMTHFVYKPHWPGLPHRDAMAQLEAFGTEVVPKLRS